VQFTGKFPAFLILYFQKTHAERAQRCLGLFSRAQFRIEHPVMDNEQCERHQENRA